MDFGFYENLTEFLSNPQIMVIALRDVGEKNLLKLVTFFCCTFYPDIPLSNFSKTDYLESESEVPVG